MTGTSRSCLPSREVRDPLVEAGVVRNRTGLELVELRPAAAQWATAVSLDDVAAS
jgi:hypothetical protein